MRRGGKDGSVASYVQLNRWGNAGDTEAKGGFRSAIDAEDKDH